MRFAIVALVAAVAFGSGKTAGYDSAAQSTYQKAGDFSAQQYASAQNPSVQKVAAAQAPSSQQYPGQKYSPVHSRSSHSGGRSNSRFRTRSQSPSSRSRGGYPSDSFGRSGGLYGAESTGRSAGRSFSRSASLPAGRSASQPAGQPFNPSGGSRYAARRQGFKGFFRGVRRFAGFRRLSENDEATN
ncbi:hypothetical protein AeMF1_006279 [Aphanomyces euteiches]|nr:hypothetical protein AeMF1_006279 [Aphanomyces euteiches]